MSKNIKEIEVKARVKSFVLVKKKLERLGCKFLKPITQEDQIFLRVGDSFSNFKMGSILLRIRKQNNQKIFTLKKRQEAEMSSIEKEIVIQDAKTLEEIIKYLGFHEVVKVKKVRTKCKYKNYEVCLDQVKNLGNFIEVEKFSAGDTLKTQAELFRFLETLGVKREDRVLHGYDVLAYNKQSAISN